MPRQLAAVELDVGVPPEGVDARHERVHDVEAERAAVERHDAQAAQAAAREALELGVGDAGAHDAHAARARAELGDRGEREAVVVGVGVRLHDDDALEAEPALDGAVLRDRARARHGRARRDGRGGVVEVDVRVAGAGRRARASGGAGVIGRPSFWRACVARLACAGGAGLGICSSTANGPP